MMTVKILFLAAALLVSGGLWAQSTFSYSGAPVQIQESASGAYPTVGPNADLPIVVSGVTGPITDLSLSTTFIRYWAGEVRVTLIAPGGVAQRTLMSGVNNTGTNPTESSDFNGTYTFRNNASANLWTSAASVGYAAVIAPGDYFTTDHDAGGAFTDMVSPFSSLSAAQINGTWTLRFNDLFRTITTTTHFVVAAALTITGTNPEMHVTRGAAAIADGGTDTLYAAVAGTASTLTYTLGNLGAAALSIATPVAAPGAQVNCAAAISVQPAGSVGAYASTSLMVSVTPSAAGAFSCTVSVTNSDANESPYNWTISGTATAAPAPEIQIARVNPISDGGVDSLPGTTVTNVTQSIYYTITNLGSANLTLTLPISAPTAQAGCVASILTQPPSAIVAPGASTTFEMLLRVPTNLSFSLQLSVGNNDSDENPYNFTVSGSSGFGGEISVSREGALLIDGGSDSLGTVSTAGTTVVFTVSNQATGFGNLNFNGAPRVSFGSRVNCSVWVVTPLPASLANSTTTTFSFRVAALAAGAFSFTLSIPNDDSTEGPFDQTVSGTGTTSLLPEMDVVRGTSPVYDNATDGSLSIMAGTTAAITYTITNNGPATLVLSTPVAAPTNLLNCTATVTVQPAGSIASAATTTLVVSISPIAFGTYRCEISIDNNDGNENPFNWQIMGLGTTPAPEIAAARGATNINDNSTDNVGSAFTVGVPASLTYTISNIGSLDLTLTNPATLGALTNCSASITTAPASPVSGSSSTTIQLSLTATASGAFSFTYSIANNDSNENPFNWTVSGSASVVAVPEMDVSRNATAVADGATDTLTGATASLTSVLIYDIDNVGTATLTLTTPVAAPGSPVNCIATIGSSPSGTIAASGSSSLWVNVTPVAAGAFSCTLTISNNDSDENPYNWTISGTAVPNPVPEMGVTRGASPISDGGADNLTGALAGANSGLTYTISNSGAAALTLTVPVSAPGTQTNCAASISTQPAASVAAAGSTTLIVSLTPTAPGFFSCTLSISNNDANESPYNWTISGTASAIPAPEIDLSRGATAVASGSSDTLGAVNFGAPQTVTYTVANTGTAGLNLTGSPSLVAATAGANLSSVALTTAPASSLAAAASTTFVVTYTVAAPGAFDFTHSIDNDDANENPYAFTVQGSGTGTAPSITSAPAPATALDGLAYSHQFTASGNPAPTFAVTAGTLPAWASLSGAGLLSGLPVMGQNGTFTVSAQNGVAPDATEVVSITVLATGVAPTITSPAAPTTATVSAVYTHTFTATGTPAPTFSATGLPPWLTLDPISGLLTGTPAAFDVGTAGPITFTATNGVGPDDNQTFSIIVSSGSGKKGGKKDDDGCAASSGATSGYLWMPAGLTLATLGYARLRRRTVR